MSLALEHFVPEKTILFDESIRFHPELTFGEKVFLAEIQSLTADGKSVNFSSRRLAEIFNVSHQTIVNWVKRLNTLGLIKVDLDFDSPYTYKKAVIKGVKK